MSPILSAQKIHHCVVVAVYILPDAISKNALHESYEVISTYIKNNWMVFLIVACNFNQTDLRTFYLNFTSMSSSYPGDKIPQIRPVQTFLAAAKAFSVLILSADKKG